MGQLGALPPPASVDEGDLKARSAIAGIVRCRARRVAYRDPSIRQVLSGSFAENLTDFFRDVL